MPSSHQLTGAIADIFDALTAPHQDTRLAPDIEYLLWATVNLFHRAAGRLERQLDDNEQAKRRSQDEQDGSEIRSVELETLIREGLSSIERRNTFEYMCDQAAEAFERHTDSVGHPRRLQDKPQPSRRRDDRQPGFHRRQAPRRY